MTSMPMGDDGRKYNETCMLIEAYAQRLLDGKISYRNLLENIDRLTQLGNDCRRLWGDDKPYRR